MNPKDFETRNYILKCRGFILFQVWYLKASSQLQILGIWQRLGERTWDIY